MGASGTTGERPKRLTGSFDHTVDDKGRLVIPRALRHGVPDGSLIVPARDRCLQIVPGELFDSMAMTHQSDLQLGDQTARFLSRVFFSLSAEVALDKAGRFLIPSPLREYAQLTGPCVVSGQFDRIEIASKEIWDQMSDEGIRALGDQMGAS